MNSVKQQILYFSSILKVLGHPPQNFMVIGFIDKLQKFTQGSLNDKRKIYNSQTICAMTLKFLPELLLIKNSSPTKFHNFWSLGTQDII